MSITFNDVCNLLEAVEKISSKQARYTRTEKKERIQRTIYKWFFDHRTALNHPDTNGGAVLSAIFPHRRKDRVYGLQPPLLSKKITKLLGFNHGQRALFDKWSTSVHGDLGKYIALAIKPWDGTFKTKRLIAIKKVDDLLTQLAAKYRFSDPAIQQRRDWHMSTDTELKYILTRLESWEAKWFVRLILREYPTLDLDETYVFEQYHFLLADLLKFQNDFDAAFRILRGDLSCYPSAPEPPLQKSMRIEAAKKLKAVVGVRVGRPHFYKAWSFKHCFQMVGDHAWAAEIKYDGEYCEIHIDLDNAPENIRIFSKNGKDATADRQALHSTIRDALGIGQPSCQFGRRCIVLGEMVLYSDKEKKILSFSKIRKHISRSGSFMGTLQDSLPHEWEHLMLVFFDVLMLDDKPVLRQCLQERRLILRNLVRVIPSRSMRSEWTLVDFKTGDGTIDLKQAFAQTLAHRQEGLVLKPLHSPYFPLLYEVGHRQPGFFIKLKKDYLGDMGGERDLGDFAIIGASFDPRVAPKTDIQPLHWTHFHLGCVMDKLAVQRSGAKPKFKVVGCLSLDKCIPKPELKHLNIYGQLQKAVLHRDGSIDKFNIDHGHSYDYGMSVAFKEPFVAEILGGGYEKVQNETFEMLRHPRVKKIHHDRTWEDAVTLEDLERMSEENWDVPNADNLDGHAKDVAILAKRYKKELSSQITESEYETTQETTQRTTERTSQETPSDAVVQETHAHTFEGTHTSMSSTQLSGSTQGVGIRASREIRVLVREDTSERLVPSPTAKSGRQAPPLPTPPSISNIGPPPTSAKRSFAGEIVSPPASKRRKKIRSPLKDAGGNRNLGAFDYDSQERVIHIYAEEGWRVQVHTGPEEE